MRVVIIALAWLVLVPGSSEAALRVWKSRDGQEIKAEFIGGVLENKIVLKLPGNKRLYVRLSEFSLEDRDYLVDYFTNKKDADDIKKLASIMLAENKVPVIDPDAKKPGPDNSGGEGYGEGIASGRGPMDRGSFNPLTNPNLNRPPAEVETEMYGLPLPSPELLVEDQVRTWTNLLGHKEPATFDRVLAPGFLRLKKADGTTGDFALVNFSRADIDYVNRLLQTDLERPVFPEGNGFQSLTPEDVSRGYRVWTDRKNVSLIGKFIAIKSKNVVIEVNGQNQEYPKAGLSETDKSWVENEIKRRAEAARANQQASSTPSGQSRFSPFGGNAGGNRFRPGGHGEGNRFGMGGQTEGTGNRFGGSLFTYSFHCDHCGHNWTDSIGISPCPNCKDKRHFECWRCGHKWTRDAHILRDPCPKCSGRLDNLANSQTHSEPTATSSPSTESSSSSLSSLAGGSSSSAGKKESEGVLMTVVYVLMGLGVLAGIAAGLFRAFG